MYLQKYSLSTNQTYTVCKASEPRVDHDATECQNERHTFQIVYYFGFRKFFQYA